MNIRDVGEVGTASPLAQKRRVHQLKTARDYIQGRWM